MARDDTFYVTGGTLGPDAPSYVERGADEELFQALRGGEFCYVLTPRQMGKSSLMVRTAARLREDGNRVAVLDLTAIGQSVTAEQWYRGLLDQLGQRLDLEDELAAFWQAHQHLGPLQRWVRAIEHCVLAEGLSDERLRAESRDPAPQPSALSPQRARRVVLFIDEIDSVRGLPFSTDEFFASIRECYNRRAEDPVFERLAFCLLGVASPADLIRDPHLTPFNIGRRVELHDFTAGEARILAVGLEVGTARTSGRPAKEARAIMRRILYWTGGHPYLTQRLCATVATRQNGAGGHEVGGGESGNGRRGSGSPILPLFHSPTRLVDGLCASLFLSRAARKKDDNLFPVREHLLRGHADVAGVLDLYARILRSQRAGIRRASRVPDDQNPLVELLKLAGIARVESGKSGNWEIRKLGNERTGRSPSFPIPQVPNSPGSQFPHLRVRNRIYARVFDREWVRANMPDAELRRQRAAFRRGAARAGAVAALVLAVVSGLGVMALKQASRLRTAAGRLETALGEKDAALADLRRTMGERDRKAAEANRNAAAARAAEETAAARADESNERLARAMVTEGQRVLEEGDLFGSLLRFTQALAIEKGQPERQEVERRRIGALLATAPRLVRYWSGLDDAEMSPDGRRVLTIGGGQARVWDGTTGEPVGPPTAEGGGIGSGRLSPDGRRAAVLRQDGGVRILDTATGAPAALMATAGLTGIRGDYLFSSDGRKLLLYGRQTARAWNVATGRPAGPPLRHPTGTTRPSFSPDGRRAAIESGYVVFIWNVENGALIARLEDPEAVSEPAFSPDGRLVATRIGSQHARVWDAATGRSVSPDLGGPDGTISRLEFSPDSTRLMASTDQSVQVLNARTGRLLLEPLQGQARFSPDGARIASASAHGTARVWDAATGTPVSAPMVASVAIGLVGFTADGRRVATIGGAGAARLWVTATGEPVTPSIPTGRGNRVTTMVSRDGGQLFSLRETTEASHDARLWDLTANRSPALLVKPAGGVGCAAFSPDSRLLATGLHTGLVEVRDLASGRVVASVPAPGPRPGTVRFSVDGRRLLAIGGSLARVWDTTAWAPLLTLRHDEEVREACFSPDGRRIATASGSVATLWDAATGRRLLALRGQGKHVDTLAFSRDGGRLLTRDEIAAQVWETRSGRLLTTLRDKLEISGASFSPDGRQVLLSGDWFNAKIYDAATGRPVLFLRHTLRVRDAVFSPNGRLIATGGGVPLSLASSEASIWDAVTGRRLGPSVRQPGEVRTVAFSADGRYLATGSFGGEARVWDVATGKAVTPPLPHDAYVWEASFSPDGRYLLTGDGKGGIRIWSLPRAGGTAAQLSQMAEMLAGQRLEGGGEVPLTPEETAGAWERAAPLYRAQCAPPPGRAAAWHDQEARACEEAGLPAFAALHLDALLQAHLPDPSLALRLAAARGGPAEELAAAVLPAAPAGALVVLRNYIAVQRNGRDGGPLRIGDARYSRGLFCHSPSMVVVALPGPARRFTATCGIDSSESSRPGRGSVNFSVRIGQQEPWRSPLLREGMPGVAVSVALGGARAFTLVVGDGGDGNSCDQADWADARVELEDGRVLWLGDLPIVTLDDQ